MADRAYPYKESLRVGMLLTMTAGFIDAYTFAFHDGRFASLQSGNVIQTAINLSDGHWQRALTFIVPIIFFALGAAFNALIKRYHFINQVQWEELSVTIEALGIAFVTLLAIFAVPSGIVIPALSFFMAMQADTFSKLRGAPYATVMSTGNIKTFGAMLAGYALTHDKAQLAKARNISMVIATFFFGAFLSTLLAKFIGASALFGGTILLVLIWTQIRQDRQPA